MFRDENNNNFNKTRFTFVTVKAQTSTVLSV